MVPDDCTLPPSRASGFTIYLLLLFVAMEWNGLRLVADSFSAAEKQSCLRLRSHIGMLPPLAGRKVGVSRSKEVFEIPKLLL